MFEKKIIPKEVDREKKLDYNFFTAAGPIIFPRCIVTPDYLMQLPKAGWRLALDWLAGWMGVYIAG